MSSVSIQSDNGPEPERSPSKVGRQQTFAAADLSRVRTAPISSAKSDALPSQLEIRQALEAASSRLAGSSAELQFQVDYESKTLSLTLVDRETGQVLATIPKSLLTTDLASVARGLGAFIDQRW